MFQESSDDIKGETLDFSTRYLANHDLSSPPTELKESLIPAQQAMLILPNGFLAVGSTNCIIQLIDTKLHQMSTLDHKKISFQSIPYLQIKIDTQFNISIKNIAYNLTYSSFLFQNVISLCVFPDGTLISGMNDCKQIYFWDTKINQCILVVDVQFDNENYRGIHAISNVSNHYLAMALDHKIILIWNTQDNKAFILENGSAESENTIYTLISANNNQLISVTISGTILVSNLETKITHTKLPDCTGCYAWPININNMVHLAYFPKAKNAPPHLSIFELTTGTQIKTYKEKSRKCHDSAIAMLPSGEIIGMNRTGEIILFKDNPHECKEIVPSPPRSSCTFWKLLVLPDGRLAYGGKNGIYLSRSNIRTLNYSEIETELKSLPNPRAIKKITLKNTYIEDNDIPKLTALLEHYSELLHLDIRNTNISLKSVVKLREHFHSRNKFIVRHQQDDPLVQPALACYESSLRLQNFLSSLNKDVTMQTQNTPNANQNAAASIADLKSPAAPDAKSPIPVTVADNKISATSQFRARTQSATAPVAAALPRPQHQHAASLIISPTIAQDLRVITEDEKRPSSPMSSGDEASSPPRAASPLLHQPLSPRDRRINLEIDNPIHQADAVQYFQGENELKLDFKTPDSSYNFKIIDYLAWLNNKRASVNKRSAWIYPIPHDGSRTIGSAVINTLRNHKTRFTAGIRRDQKEEINDLFLFIIEIKLTEATSHYFVGVIIEETLLIINPTDGIKINDTLQQTTLEIVSFLKSYNPIKNIYVVNTKPNVPDNPGTDSSGTFGIELLLNLANNINKKDFIGIFKFFPKLKMNPKIVRVLPSNSQLAEISFVPGDMDHINLLFSSILKELYLVPHKRAYIERLTHIKQSHLELLTQNGKSDLAVAVEQELAPSRNTSKHPCAVILTKVYELQNLKDTVNKQAIRLKFENIPDKKRRIEGEKKATESNILNCKQELEHLIKKIKRKELISWRGKEYLNKLMHFPLLIHLLEHHEALHLLLKMKNKQSKQFDINLYDNDESKNTAVHIAASKPKLLPSLNILLEQSNIDLNRRNKAGNTPLHEAITANCFDAFVALLTYENQIQFNLINEAGETITYSLVKNKRFEWIKKILINPSDQPYNTIPGKSDWIATFNIKGNPARGIHSALELMKTYELEEKIKYDDIHSQAVTIMRDYKDIIPRNNFLNFGEYDKFYRSFIKQYQAFGTIEKELDTAYTQYFLHVYIHAIMDSDYYPEKDNIELLHQCRKILFCCFVFKFINECHKKLDVNPKSIKSILGTQITTVNQQLTDQKNLLSKYENEITKLWSAVSQNQHKINNPIFDEAKRTHDDFLKNKSPSEHDDLSLSLPKQPSSLELKEIRDWKDTYDDYQLDIPQFQINSSQQRKIHEDKMREKQAQIDAKIQMLDKKQEKHDSELKVNIAEHKMAHTKLVEPTIPQNYRQKMPPPDSSEVDTTNSAEVEKYLRLEANVNVINEEQKLIDEKYDKAKKEFDDNTALKKTRIISVMKKAKELNELKESIADGRKTINKEIFSLDQERKAFQIECDRDTIAFHKDWAEVLDEKRILAINGYNALVIHHQTIISDNLLSIENMEAKISALEQQASEYLAAKNFKELAPAANKLLELDEARTREQARLNEYKTQLTSLRNPLQAAIIMTHLIHFLPMIIIDNNRLPVLDVNSIRSLIVGYFVDCGEIKTLDQKTTRIVSAPNLSLHGLFGDQSRSLSPQRTRLSFALGTAGNETAILSRSRGSTHHLPMLPTVSGADAADHKYSGSNGNANASAEAAAAPGIGKSP